MIVIGNILQKSFSETLLIMISVDALACSWSYSTRSFLAESN